MHVSAQDLHSELQEQERQTASQELGESARTQADRVGIEEGQEEDYEGSKQFYWGGSQGGYQLHFKQYPVENEAHLLRQTFPYQEFINKNNQHNHDRQEPHLHGQQGFLLLQEKQHD